MILNLVNVVGDWNPQLFREIKGRLKTRNVLLAIGISLLGQFILLVTAQSRLPADINSLYDSSHKYCTGKLINNSPQCLLDASGNAIINWQLWSLDVFNLLSFIGCFAFLVGGVYLLISDLATEERRDTLNFIRLSPQSPQSILWGKILGVPLVLYLIFLLAIPLHLWLGLAAQIPVSMILIFYALMFTISFFYYSGALLFGLVGSWLGSFQAWLGSGLVLVFLLFTKQIFIHNTASNNPLVILKIINPYYLIPHPDFSDVLSSNSSQLSNFHWFLIPIGTNFLATICFTVLMYGVGSYFIWQSLQRCFRDSHTTMLSKHHSYMLTACFNIITIGCADWQNADWAKNYKSYTILTENIAGLILLEFGLFLYLIAALSPHRQTLQDWARYRHIDHFQKWGNKSLIKDLTWGEKSPGTLAIAINVIITITCLSVFILSSQFHTFGKNSAFLSLAFAGLLVIIYAALAQLLLFMKNEQRILWTNGIVGAVIVLPLILLAILFPHVGNNSPVWLFSIAAPFVVLSNSETYIPAIAPFIGIVGYLGILGLLVLQLTRILRKAGESATKAQKL